MEEKMDKNHIFFGSAKEHNKMEKEYLSKLSYKEKLSMITYLRECFYGPEATTGRLQRIYKFLKRK